MPNGQEIKTKILTNTYATFFHILLSSIPFPHSVHKKNSKSKSQCTSLLYSPKRKKVQRKDGFNKYKPQNYSNESTKTSWKEIRPKIWNKKKQDYKNQKKEEKERLNLYSDIYGK